MPLPLKYIVVILQGKYTFDYVVLQGYFLTFMGNPVDSYYTAFENKPNQWYRSKKIEKSSRQCYENPTVKRLFCIIIRKP